MELLRLFDEANFLDAHDPKKVAKVVEDRLNQLEMRGLDIQSIVAIPNYPDSSAHEQTYDKSGISDAYFLVNTKASSLLINQWRTEALGDQFRSLNFKSSASLYKEVKDRVSALTEEGFLVKHFLTFVDFEAQSMWGARDLDGYPTGVRAMIICYHPMRDLPTL